MELFKDHWLLIAFLAPLFWAMVNMIDVYFVDGIYQDELDGTIIFSLFQMVPWLVLFWIVDIPLGEVMHTERLLGAGSTTALSFLGGVLYACSFYCYFKTLFRHNDASLLQVLWNLTVVVVPALSFLLFGEILPVWQYVGMVVVLLGATMLSLNPKLRERISKNYLATILGAVFFLSLSMIVQDRAYGALTQVYGSDGFWVGFFFFGVGAFVAGLATAFLTKRNPLPLVKRYGNVFILGEGIYFLGTLFSQRALDIAPSASSVAVIETFVPVFILLYSLLIIAFFSIAVKKKSKVVKKIYSEQIGGIWIKIIATSIMAFGVYIIS